MGGIGQVLLHAGDRAFELADEAFHGAVALFLHLAVGFLFGDGGIGLDQRLAHGLDGAGQPGGGISAGLMGDFDEAVAGGDFFGGFGQFGQLGLTGKG